MNNMSNPNYHNLTNAYFLNIEKFCDLLNIRFVEDVKERQNELDQRSQGEINDAKGIIINMFSEHNVSEGDVLILFNMYDKVAYTTGNAARYLDAAFYFGFTTKNKILEHIIQQYILDGKLLECICNNQLVCQHLRTIAKDPQNNLTKANIEYIGQHVTLEELYANVNEVIDLSDGIIRLTFSDTFNPNITNKKIEEKVSTDENIKQENGYDVITSVIITVTKVKKQKIPSTVKYVKFGKLYNQHTDIPENVEELILGNYFNSTIKFAQKSKIKSLVLPPRFNQSIIIPDGVESVKFRGKFNSAVTFSNTIKRITFGTAFNQLVNLPINLETVTFGSRYNQKTDLPSNTKGVRFGRFYNQTTVLPDSVTYAKFDYWFNNKVILSKNLKKVIFGTKYNQPTVFPDNVEHIVFNKYHSKYNQPTTWSKNLKVLQLNQVFDQQTTFPDKLKELYFGSAYNRVTIFPNSIEKLELGSSYNQQTTLPSNLKELSVNGTDNYNSYNYYNYTSYNSYNIFDNILALPNTIKKLIWNRSESLNKCVTFGNNITDVTIVIQHPGYDYRTNIPKGVKHIVWNSSSQRSLLNFASTTTHLTENRYDINTCSTIPNGITHYVNNSYVVGQITFPNSTTHAEFKNHRGSINTSNMTHLVLSGIYNYTDNITLPGTLTNLTLKNNFNNVTIPPSVTELTIDDSTCYKYQRKNSNHSNLIIPNTVSKLTLIKSCNGINIPANVKTLIIGKDCNGINIPNTVENLTWNSNQEITALSSNLINLTIKATNKFPIKIPSSVKQLMYGKKNITVGTNTDIFTFA